MKVRVLLALACLAAAAPATAQVSLGLEATIGGQHLGVTHAPGAGELAAMGDAGATLLLRLGPLGLGAAAEGNFDGTSLQRYNASGLAGLMGDLLPVLRLELLGELGVAGLRSTAQLRQEVAGNGGSARFYGFRPGLSMKLPAFPLRVGVWGLARWGLPGTGSGPQYGMLARIGIEL